MSEIRPYSAAQSGSSVTNTGFGPAPQPQSQGSGINRLANQDIFMKLLVAQLQHQNPLNPADGIEFMTQLTQFSQLEQIMGARQELETIRKALTDPPAVAQSGGNQATP